MSKGKNYSIYVPFEDTDTIQFFDRAASEMGLSRLILDAIRLYRARELDLIELQISEREHELASLRERQGILTKRLKEKEFQERDRFVSNFNLKTFSCSIHNLLVNQKADEARKQINSAIGLGCISEQEAKERWEDVICQRQMMQ